MINNKFKLKNKYKIIFKIIQNTYIFFSAVHLRQFFLGMRTRYGKLSKIKSGQGASQFTERDQMIFNTFKFLDSYIRRIPSRSSQKVCT